MQEMRRLVRDHRHYSFSALHAPVLTIEPGESIIVETNDARTGTVRSSADLLDKPHPVGANPVTGPIRIAGAELGDSLVVHVHGIALGRQAYTGVKARIGLLADSAPHYATKVLPVEEGYIRFSDTICFPVWPMIGCIGTAPAAGEIACLYPGAHGGNMDNKFVRPGCSLHLPVLIPGANLSLGDVHASMGDGEVSMVGLEAEAEVTIKVDLLKGVEIARPWIEDDQRWITTGDDMDTDEALRMACREMVALLMRRLKIPFEEAYMLASIRADLGVCQACDPGRFPVTTRMSYDSRVKNDA